MVKFRGTSVRAGMAWKLEDEVVLGEGYTVKPKVEVDAWGRDGSSDTLLTTRYVGTEYATLLGHLFNEPTIRQTHYCGKGGRFPRRHFSDAAHE